MGAMMKKPDDGIQLIALIVGMVLNAVGLALMIGLAFVAFSR
jgi:hypothetical protein